MKIVIKIDQRSKKGRLFLDFMKSLDFVEFIESGKKSESNDPNEKTSEFYKMVALGAKQAKEIASGKRKGKPLQKALNEL